MRFDRPIVVLDFETTGLSPDNGDRITEVAALRVVDGRVVDTYVSLVNCGVRIPPFITSLTGISQAMVDRAPPCAEVVPELVAFIGADPLACHNASFDEKFLLAESAGAGLRPSHSALICSLKLSRRVFPGLASYKLGTLASNFRLRWQGDAHRAEADAQVTVQLLNHIAAHLGDRYGLPAVAPDLLVTLNQRTAAQADGVLRAHAAQRKPA
jgi:DNA polymerase-3 subunit epsilon